MCFFILIRKADELGINFWLRLLAVGLGVSLLLQGYYYFSAINRVQPVSGAATTSEEAEKDRTDVALTNKIRSAIAQTKRLYMLSIGVKNHDGIITLSGEVPSDIDRELAANVARETPGVQSVQNEIQIVASLKRANEGTVQASSAVNVEDLEMAANLREMLQAVPALQSLPIQIKVHQRIVTLSGQVATEPQRQQAEQIVHNAPKVVSIQNQLRVGR
jgi:osmotically-inducible protein OsmY